MNILFLDFIFRPPHLLFLCAGGWLSGFLHKLAQASDENFCLIFPGTETELLWDDLPAGRLKLLTQKKTEWGSCF
jgi:hypothetical protein